MMNFNENMETWRREHLQMETCLMETCLVVFLLLLLAAEAQSELTRVRGKRRSTSTRSRDIRFLLGRR